MRIQTNSRILIVALGLFLLEGCTAQTQPQSPSENQPCNTEETQEGQQEATEQPCQLNLENPSLKNALSIIPATTMQLSPDVETVISSGDYKECSKLTDPEKLLTCESTLIINKAITTNDESLCDKATLDVVKQRCHNALNSPFLKH